MEVRVKVPPEKEILRGGKEIKIAKKGESWSGSQLEDYSNCKGVYVIHHGGSTKYVGRTRGKTMDFATRLRREFQFSASQGRHIYPKLARLRVPPEIKVFFVPYREIHDLIEVRSGELTNVGLSAVLESALIHAYRPEFQEGEWGFTQKSGGV